MASDFEKPNKVHTLFSTEIVEKLWPLDVGELFMCGKRTKEELNKLNIYTIKDLANTDIKKLDKYFKSQGRYLHDASLGIDNSKVETRSSKNQSISISETLPHNYNDRDKLKEIIFRQTEEVTRQLRSKKMYTKTICITFKNDSFISYSAQISLDNPTNNTKEILKTAYEVFDSNYKDDSIRLIGVRLSNLTNNKNEQVSIFNIDEENNEEDSIQKTIDNINNKFGKSVIKPASLKVVGESSRRMG